MTSDDNNNNDDSKNETIIKEGSAIMTFPANQESTVFYNPVQVQNRDLSVLMISLYAERRAIRQAVKEHKKELLKKARDEAAEEGRKQTKQQQQEAAASLQEELKAYESTFASNLELSTTAKTNGLAVLDALAASGLRSIRYWKEIPGIKHVTINDLEFEAIERAKRNLKTNGLKMKNETDDDGDDDNANNSVILENNIERNYGICPQIGDATHVMYMSRRPQQLRTVPPHAESQHSTWDVIDLDPYGSAAPFLDGAVQAVENGGFLCITCTDMAALGGSHPETAYGRYAGLPIQSAKYLQELALRILLHTVSVSAARYGRTIKPILCVGMDFYVRIFVEVNNDKKGVTDLSLNTGHVYQSTKCSTFVTLPHGQMGGKKKNVYQSIRLDPSCCPETGASFKVGGPIWLGPLHDQDVVKTALKRLSDPKCMAPNMELLATRKRLEGLLTTVSEELDTPLFYNLSDLCRVLHCQSPPMDVFKAGIYNAGYGVSGYHKDPMAIKTDAPSRIVWDVMRAWLAKHPSAKPPPEGSMAEKMLAVPPSIEVDFTIPKSFQNKPKVSRFPSNPERHWGPKRKASNVVPKSNGDENTKDEDGNHNNDEEPPAKRIASEANGK
jgi:tRNA (guanine26-N2/guanine27-N2)-dimethyltransferase